MNLLLDSHSFIWWREEPRKLSPTAFSEISNPNNNVFLSVATVWELQIKIAINKFTINSRTSKPFTSASVNSSPLSASAQFCSCAVAVSYSIR